MCRAAAAELAHPAAPLRGPRRLIATPDPWSYCFIGNPRDGSAVLNFDPPQGVMQAHYLARWVTRR